MDIEYSVETESHSLSEDRARLEALDEPLRSQAASRLAFRCALRAFPFATIQEPSDELAYGLFLSTKCLMIADCFAHGPTSELRDMRKEARKNLITSAAIIETFRKEKLSTLEVATNAVLCQAISTSESTDLGQIFEVVNGSANVALAAQQKMEATLLLSKWSDAYSADLLALETNPAKPLRGPVWPGKGSSTNASTENAIQSVYQRMLGLFGGFEEFSNFLRNWFVNALNGEVSYSATLGRLILVSDEIWIEGPAAVAREFDRIQEDLLAEKSQLAETLEYDPGTDKIHVRHIPVQEPAHIDALLDAVEDALEIACLKGNTNPNEGVYASLRMMLEKRRDKPQSIEITCSRVATDLRRMIAVGELPDDSNQTGLLTAVEDLGRGVRAAHPEVAANRERMVAQSLRELKEEDHDKLIALQDLVEQVGDETFVEETREDVAALIGQRGYVAPGAEPKLPPVDAAARLAHRTLGLKEIALNASYEGGKVYGKATRKGAIAWDSDTGKSLQLVLTASPIIAGVIGVMLATFGII